VHGIVDSYWDYGVGHDRAYYRVVIGYTIEQTRVYDPIIGLYPILPGIGGSPNSI